MTSRRGGGLSAGGAGSHLRWADAGDWERCRRLIADAWRAGYAPLFTAAEIEGAVSGRVTTAESWAGARKELLGTLVADRDGIIAGLASLCGLQGGEIELALLYVHPACQRQGVGSALFSAAVSAGRERGCDRLRVWTLRRGHGRRFYEARGCVAVGEGEYRVGERAEPVIEYAVDLRGG